MRRTDPVIAGTDEYLPREGKIDVEEEHTSMVEGFSRQSCSSQCQRIHQTHSQPICSTRCDTERGRSVSISAAHRRFVCDLCCAYNHATCQILQTPCRTGNISGCSTTVSVSHKAHYAYPGILVLHKVSSTNRAEILLPSLLLSHEKGHCLMVHWYVHLDSDESSTCTN